MPILSIDFETRSVVDLRKCGVYVYAAHPSTNLWCMAYAFDDEPVELWRPGNPLPRRVVEHVIHGGEMRAWNAQFERLMWREVGRARHNFPTVRDEQWFCTAADAAAMALPRHLDDCARVLKVQAQKDQEGYRVMLQVCKPRSVKDGVVVWWSPDESPEKFNILFDYCRQDVNVERAIMKVTRRLSAAEREVFLLDQKINDRGVRIDRPLVTAALSIVSEGMERANKTVREVTGDRASAVTQVGNLKKWLAEQGIAMESLRKSAVKELLAVSDIPEAVRQVVEARRDAGRSSTSKLRAMLDVASRVDDRMRGLMLYHGANTGRWAGRLVQPHNFPRGEVKNPEQYIEEVLRGEYDVLDLFHPPLLLISGLLRGCLVPAPGHRFTVVDFSAIEARVTAWLAQEEKLTELFRSGGKVYETMAARIYGKWVEDIQPSERQLGKATILGCGFGMGGEKFHVSAWEQYGVAVGREFADEVVATYRAAFPRIPQYWYDLDRAAMRAVENPGETQQVRNVKFLVKGPYLWCILPSGRPLAYAAPKIVDRETPWGEIRPTIEAWSINSITRKWDARKLYGGLLTENIVQATARDLMVHGMLTVEHAGYPVILTVHDEIVSEPPEGHGSLKEFETLIATPPAWAATCPVAVEGWEGDRYHK